MPRALLTVLVSVCLLGLAACSGEERHVRRIEHVPVSETALQQPGELAARSSSLRAQRRGAPTPVPRPFSFDDQSAAE